MELKLITSSDGMWNKVRDYAENCSWSAGKSLADAMDNNLFTEWERVIVALDHQKICGYCTVAKTDCIPDVSDHENLYEKYGFEIIDRKTAPWGSVEKIYMQRL